jgi:hypothetical protein
MNSAFRAIVVLAIACALLSITCSPGSSAASSHRSSSLTVSVSPVPAFAAPIPHIVVNDGTLDLQSAVFSIDSVVIEEHTDGDDDDEHDDLGPANESGDHGDEGDDEEIVMPGPFTVDIASGDVQLGTASVFPGTFTKVEITLRPNGQPHSIVVTGSYVANGGGSTPFTLHSAFTGEFEAPLAGGGITVTENSVVPIVVSFDLAGMFDGLDFAGATVSGGTITIDDTNNTALLQAFEAQLEDCVGFCGGDDDGDNGDDDGDNGDGGDD